MHSGIFDSELWKILYQNVVDRSDKIDVLYSAPERHLIELPDKKIIGAKIEKMEKSFNVRDRNDVVLALSGFENNNTMIQDYF